MTYNAEKHKDLEIRPTKLIAICFKNRWLIVSLSLIFAILLTFSSFLINPKYTSSALLKPNNHNTSANSVLSSTPLGGLAGIAGFTMDDEQTLETNLAILKSSPFIISFIEKYSLEKEILTEEWDEKNQEWKKGASILSWFSLNEDEDASTREDKRQQKAYKKFLKEHLEISHDSKTGMVEISLTTEKREKSPIWASTLISMINEHIRQKDLAKIEQNISFLEDTSTHSNSVAVKNAAYQNIEEQLKRKMMANISSDYAFEVIDPPIKPLKKSSPKRIRYLAFGALIGLSFGILISLIRDRKLLFD